MIPASEPGSCSQVLSTMPVPTPVHRQIAGVVQHARKPFQPQCHLLLVDVNHVQPLGAGVQFVGVLGVITMQSGIIGILTALRTVRRTPQRLRMTPELHGLRFQFIKVNTSLDIFLIFLSFSSGAISSNRCLPYSFVMLISVTRMSGSIPVNQ